MLTEHQHQALDHKSNLVVTANAGAGKTTVLVHRFVEILLQTDAQISELAAITFTEKAAGELRKKISDHVEKKIIETQGEAEKLKYEHIRNSLASANIGTIHSFCAQLLHEFPVEANVDAAFTILDGIDQNILENESINEAFESILTDNENSNRREELMDLIRFLGRNSIESFLKIFISKRDQIDRWIVKNGFNTDTSDKVIKYWNQEIMNQIEILFDENEWLSAVNKIINVAQGTKADEARILFKKWNSKYKLLDKISLFKEISEIIFTDKYTLRQNFIGSKTDWSFIKHEVDRASDLYRSIASIICGLFDQESLEANKTLAHLLGILIILYHDAVRLYNEKKLDYGKLDFEDILLKTKNLLKQDVVQSSIVRKFRYIMVDEFQDTNMLQYEILQLLTLNLKSGNLFIVGDPKQSIYGFRDAEVEVFEKMKSEILQTVGGKEIVLAESFRLLPNIIDFVNRVFSKTMSNKSSMYEVKYDELVLGRKKNADGKIDMLLLPANDEELNGMPDTIKAIEQECRLIANHIIRLVDEKETIFSKKDETPKPFQFKDAAVLLRQRTHLPTLEKVFNEHNIPYVISGGVGFYQTQEVMDFLNYLRFLLDPDDDIACVGIYRSPFFLISDAELYEISLIIADSFWKKSLIYADKADSGKNIQRAVALLTEQMNLTNRISIPELVQDIFQKTGWIGTIAGSMTGEQNLANIQKLLGMARDFETEGYKSLYDFIQRLMRLVDQEEREGQASIDVRGDCVQLMTVHAAKGLEFPVVYIPFIHKEFKYDKEPYINLEYGIGFGVKAKDNLDKKINPTILEIFKTQSRMKTDAEEKRIFYVACTRARDILVLSGKMKNEQTKSSYLNWVCESLNIQPVNLSSGKHLFSAMPMKVLNTSCDGISFSIEQHNLSINFYSILESRNNIKAEERSVVSQKFTKELIQTKFKGQIQGEVFSATQIKTYLECPRKYYLKYLLGMPDGNNVPKEFDEIDESNDHSYGQVEGLVTHEVLRRLDSSAITTNELKKIVENVIVEISISIADSSKIIERVMKNVCSFIESELGKDKLNMKTYQTEYSINISFGENYLTGTIDRLWMEDEKWKILDYKTDSIDSKNLDTFAELYKPQILFYSLLINKLYNQNCVEAFIVFLRHSSKPIHFKFNLPEIEQFEKRIQNSILNIQNRQFKKDMSLCEKCPYISQNICRM